MNSDLDRGIRTDTLTLRESNQEMTINIDKCSHQSVKNQWYVCTQCSKHKATETQGHSLLCFGLLVQVASASHWKTGRLPDETSMLMAIKVDSREGEEKNE